MLKKYFFLFLLPLSMTSFGQSLHAEQDASENTQQALEKETQKAVNEEPQQVLKENSQQALSKEMVIKNLDIEKASRWRRFFAGSSTVILEGAVSFGLMGVVMLLVADGVFEGNSPSKTAGKAFLVNKAIIFGSLLFSLFAGCMSFNALFKLKIVGKNGEDTTFGQRFWYAFSFWLFPFVCSIMVYLGFYFNNQTGSFNALVGSSLVPICLTLLAQLVLLVTKKKTISEYVTGMQVVKKKPSVPVKK